MDSTPPPQPALLLLSDEQLLLHRDMALGQMKFARTYLLGLIENVPDSLWHEIPAGSPSHLAWQIGHLAVAQYGLMLFRQRGRAEGDMELMPGWLRKKYGRGTKATLENIESKEMLLNSLSQIHERSMFEVATASASQLAETIDMPYAVYPNKLGALLFCPLHESIHIGQIGVLRRMLGLDPVR